ncbi:MAG: bifunctional folylpolyglutamate synthase/dihydrofolate synthase [Lachnospiraceae bacterium]|nr:bifunctional folylpolyglutamate synthase/dihydrofolate synthase [Lachnospiraceae bacterium]
MDRYKEACNYILGIPRFAGKNTLSDTHALLERVYEEGSAKVIHIAGTNGKGSVTEYLNSILLEEGKSVGMFTSPHLVRMNERIKINGSDISDEDFTACYEDIMDIIKKEGEDKHPSFFEFLFLMAMDWFSKKGVEYILLETGLGGRLDATNCIRQKDLCIITKIGLDHTEYLGDTIEQIAGEKAGIIAEGVPTVFYDNEDESTGVIKEACRAKNSDCYPINVQNAEITSADKQSIDFSLGCRYYRIRGLKLTTSALYQVYNAQLSVMGAYILSDGNLDRKAVREGLLKAFWPGRMEQIMPGVFVDGAHNADGIEAFLSSVRGLSDVPENDGSGKGRTHRLLLFGVVKDKNYDLMIKKIADSKLFDHIFAAPLESARSLSVTELKEAFSLSEVPETEFYDDVKSAFEDALASKGPEDTLYIAGSLYLAGQIKELV